MRYRERILELEPSTIGTGPRRGRVGRPRPRPWAFGRIVSLLAATIGLAWLPIPDRPAEVRPSHRGRGRSGILIRGFAVAPDGRAIAVADGFGQVTLRSASVGWDVDRTLDVRGTVVAFSPDGHSLAIGGFESDVVLCDLVRGGRRLLGVPVRETSDLRFSPDGRILAVSSYRSPEIILWDVEAGRPRMTLRGHSSLVVTMAIAPDGRSLASAAVTDPSVLVWDLESGRPRHRLASPGGISLAFSPDGRLLAIVNVGETTARIWDARTGRPLRPIGRHPLLVRSASFSPDGRLLATAAGDGTAGLWSIATGREVRRLGGQDDVLSRVAFSPDGRTLIATGHDDDLRLWDLDAPIAGAGGP